jgi:hypothetical protein
MVLDVLSIKLLCLADHEDREFSLRSYRFTISEPWKSL